MTRQPIKAQRTVRQSTVRTVTYKFDEEQLRDFLADCVRQDPIESVRVEFDVSAAGYLRGAEVTVTATITEEDVNGK